MAQSLLQPIGNISPAETLRLAQQAPEILQKYPRAYSASPLASLFSATETADTWTIYENLMVACLRTSDDTAARECLERITIRFGDKNERVLALQGLYREATASNNAELAKILEDYDTLLQENDANIPVLKRKIALLRSMGKLPEAISALNSFLDICPTDPEAWSELADMYVSQGLYAQAVYALEEVLVLSPNAWNMHARLGEVSLMAATSAQERSLKHLAEAVKRFCRSIELCDDYLRGYYGLKLATDSVLEAVPKSKKEMEGFFSLPSQETTEKLNRAATEKLAEIVRRNKAQEKLWQGYYAAEITAAEELLASSSAKIVR